LTWTSLPFLADLDQTAASSRTKKANEACNAYQLTSASLYWKRKLATEQTWREFQTRETVEQNDANSEHTREKHTNAPAPYTPALLAFALFIHSGRRNFQRRSSGILIEPALCDRDVYASPQSAVLGTDLAPQMNYALSAQIRTVPPFEARVGVIWLKV
jgi:hypothetical protein